MSALFDLFSTFGAPAKVKLVILGSLENSEIETMNLVRSLTIEHVSPAQLMGKEISRPSSLQANQNGSARHGSVRQATLLAALRRWFWARKPDAGFALSEFPATLLQAKVFDEWLDARDEALNAVLVGHEAPAAVVEYYRTLGLLHELPETSLL